VPIYYSPFSQLSEYSQYPLSSITYLNLFNKWSEFITLLRYLLSAFGLWDDLCLGTAGYTDSVCLWLWLWLYINITDYVCL